MKEYEIIVVGGGHAGCEAALASARIGHSTLLVTGNIKNIATMPCNPSIGGSAKGIIVREIDALGGEMGINADKTLIQMKMLNSSKGPSVHSLRAQADKVTYPQEMLKTLKKQKNLDLLEGMVEDLIVIDNEVKGIILSDDTKIFSQAVILTTGTYLKSDILRGSTRTRSGPHGENPSLHLSDNLKKYGLEIQRLKTGTPQRIKASSIDFSKMQKECGDNCLWTFSHDEKATYVPSEQQCCYLIYTNQNTHKIILDNLDKSAMYGGYVTGIGPRYCPSIEDKLVRFKDKERHQLFLEPESDFYPDLYLQGFSTSMPIDVQEKMVHSLKGLEHAKILKYAYAIEYDAINPLQMKPSLESKVINGLFTAGQINGTSGYEEAAGQGIIAGINASQKVKGEEPLILKRNEAYIGVLIDDLVTKGTKEPYRLLTSRAEYRLVLRHDNADLRLRSIGYKYGSVTEEQMNNLNRKKESIASLKDELASIKVNAHNVTKEILESLETDTFEVGMSLLNLLKRPQIKISMLKPYLENTYTDEVLEIVEVEIKYAGYIEKTNREIEKMLKLESKQIPDDIDYDKVSNIASEAKQKLKQIRPQTLAQATRISGVNLTDISVLSVYLKKHYSKDLKDE